MSDRSRSNGTFPKRKSWSRYGVSDIIGNLLILAITVTLFTGILFFVTSLPGPSEKVYTDFSPSLKLMGNSGNDAYINITHKGGEALYDYRTDIYLFVDEVPATLGIADGNIVGDSWPTGTTWSYMLSGVLSSTDLSIMIVDTVANTVVYSAPLQGGTQAATTLPIIADRGLTPTPAYDGSSVRFYAQISDPYGKLDNSSVFVNASSIGLSSPLPLTYNSTLTLYVSDYVTAKIAWDGANVLVCASDTSGHRVTQMMVLDITAGISTANGPYANYPDYFTNGTYPPDASGGEAGGSLGITFYYIKRTSDGTITRDFNAGEGITIEVWSDTLNNVAGQNSFYIYHPLLGVNPISPSTDAAFKIGDTFSTFRQFVFNFTAPANSYRYPFQIFMKDNQGNTFNVADYINVNGAAYPQLETYVASGNNLVRTSSFNHTDDVYLIIRTKDVDRYTDTVYISGIEVDDYTGSYVIMKAPTAVPAAGATIAYSAPLSSLYKTNGVTIAGYGNNTNTGVYTLKITLKDANQGWWLAKTNSYTLKITTFFDTGTGGTTGETYSQLSCQFSVTAPLTTTDVAAAIGSGSFTWSSSGATWENNAIAWFKGGDKWNEQVIDSDPSSGPLGLYLEDLTGDGRNDLVVGAQDTSLSNLFWYENSKSDGSAWSSARPISYPFDANSGQQTAYSSSRGNTNEDASVWSTRSGDFYDGYYTLNEMCTALAVADFDNDGDADVVASFIHVVVFTSASGTDDADYTNSYGMYFNRGIYIFWNDGSDNWERTTLYSTLDWKTASNTEYQANGNNNPAAGDIAVGDFNLDGFDDIVAVYEDGTTKVWLNMWVKYEGSKSNAFSTSESIRTLASLTGNTPWSHSQIMPKVRVADMNGDGFPDIVRTNTRAGDYSVYIFYTQQVVSADPFHSPSSEFQVSSVYWATTTGSRTNLASVDGVVETLTEVDVLYDPYNATGIKTGTDTTGSTITNAYYDDNIYYDVGQGTTMALSTFSLPFENLTTPIKTTNLVVQYHVDPLYTGTGYFQYSFNGGATWTNTNIQPKSTNLAAVTASFALTGVGGDSYSNLTSGLMVRFVNPAGSSTVHIDYVWAEVTFIKTKAVGWIYQIPNAAAAYQMLTVVGRVSGTEGFQIEYSVNNEDWFDLGQITSKTDVTQSYDLTHTSNSYYYVRITDLDRAVTDTVKDTLTLDRVIVSHNSPTVQWSSTLNKEWTSGGGYISAIAVGNMKKYLGSNVANELNDIVVTLGGNTASSGKLYILQQTASAPGTFTGQSLDTSKLAILCPASGAYEIHGVELGDLDGDQDLDIVLVVGSQIGRTPGSGPSLWEYTNNNMVSSTWRFTETPISSVAAKGESVINVTTGYIDLTIFLPIFGMMAIVATGQAMGRWRGRKK
jgi:hypothetical protein